MIVSLARRAEVLVKIVYVFCNVFSRNPIAIFIHAVPLTKHPLKKIVQHLKRVGRLVVEIPYRKQVEERCFYMFFMFHLFWSLEIGSSGLSLATHFPIGLPWSPMFVPRFCGFFVQWKYHVFSNQCASTCLSHLLYVQEGNVYTCASIETRGF